MAKGSITLNQAAGQTIALDDVSGLRTIVSGLQALLSGYTEKLFVFNTASGQVSSYVLTKGCSTAAKQITVVSTRQSPTVNEIWYYASSQQTLYTNSGLVTHTFEDGRGILTYSSTLTVIPAALAGRTNITNVKFPDKFTGQIAEGAFYNCTSLALTKLPAGITGIGGTAFYNCTSLTELTFLGTPGTIVATAFSNCTNLRTIRVPWSKGAVANAPWGATNATIIYNHSS